MIPAWFHRLNKRERILSLIIAATLFGLLNLYIWGSLLGSLRSAQQDVSARKAVRAQQNVFLRERKMWEKRDEWLNKFQPELKGPVESSTLLDQAKQAAAKHNILLENPGIGSSESTPIYQTVSVSIDTKSPWPPLVRFLYDVQQPESFVVFESVNLQIDSADPTMMRGKFKIARWFAPKQ
ncbi:MAG: hypothetical protein M3Q89_08355 [Verrucomicrobiota bacterium]|nr:hypothetical protein [Verrucomicrobiota bacterium]